MSDLNWLERSIAWLQSKEPKWFQKNSWVNEAGGAVVGTAALALVFGHLQPALIVFNVVSYLYERFADPSRKVEGHNPIDDIGQRAAGSLVLFYIVTLWGHIF